MLERLYDATKSNSDEFQERTKKFFNHKEPYDCKMTETNETYEQRCIVNDPSPLPGIKSVLGYTCWSDKDKSQKEVEKLCTQFKQDNGLQ